MGILFNFLTDKLHLKFNKAMEDFIDNMTLQVFYTFFVFKYSLCYIQIELVGLLSLRLSYCKIVYSKIFFIFLHVKYQHYL